MSARQGRDHIWAGLLNGVMIVLLGAAIPTLIVWWAATHRREIGSGLHEVDWTSVPQGVALVVTSGAIMRFGARMIRRHFAELQPDRRGEFGD